MTFNTNFVYYVQHITARDSKKFWVRHIDKTDLNLSTVLEFPLFETEEEAQKVADFNNKLYGYLN
jgi:aspartyl-tRNA synthetase